MTGNHAAKTKEALFKAIEKNAARAYALNYFMADNPEISGREYLACEKFCALLEAHGIEVERGFAGMATAWRGKVRRDPNSDANIAILAEYDALPELGHACGHCASGAVSALAAIALSECGELAGNIDIIGTPDEESSGGKIVMAEQGVFDGYDFAVMLHMDAKNVVRAELLALSAFHYKFRGRPAHAAGCPWEGRNALNGAMLMIHAFDMLRQHIRPEARIHGIILRGGDASNIIPENATVEYIARHPDSGYLDHITGLMHDCARGAALATGTGVEIDQYAPKLDSLRANPAGAALLEEIYGELKLPIYGGNRENTASSDIGNVSFRCAAFHPSIAVCDEEVSLHTHAFAAKMKEKGIEKTIAQGARVISLMVLRALTEPETLAAIRRDSPKN